MVLDRRGSHDLDALWHHTRDLEVRLLAFDLLELNGISRELVPVIAGYMRSSTTASA